jgi:urease accessory protein
MAAQTTSIKPGIDLRLLRLLQLTSPSLPVGAFAYSQGLEWVVETGGVRNARQTLDWISGVLHNGQARLDIPVLIRLHEAWQERDAEAFDDWNQYLLACRTTAELQQEDRHMGRALKRLLQSLMPECVANVPNGEISYVAMFAVAAGCWRIDSEAACAGFLWSWAENQIAAAVKLVPLGQTQGQTLLMQLAEQIPDAVKTGMEMETRHIGAVTPALSMASAKHETQHTRLFRS